jgi:gamma-glutamylcyclotransferase (GGCT)/AIG2-like uncharacterized protein YtfP
MNKKRLYAFYGTLRRDMANYKYYKNGLQFIGVSELAGYRMFSLVNYPYAVFTGNPENKITIELFEILDEVTEERIINLEVQAGYILEEVRIAEENYKIFLFADFNRQHPEISHGDWVVHKGKSSFES